MKKFVALCLALMLTLAMCVPAFARAEICADCGTHLSTRVETRMKAVKCAVVAAVSRRSVFCLSSVLLGKESFPC